MGIYQAVAEFVWASEMLGLALPEVYSSQIGKHLVFLMMVEVITIILSIENYAYNVFHLDHTQAQSAASSCPES